MHPQLVSWCVYRSNRSSLIDFWLFWYHWYLFFHLVSAHASDMKEMVKLASRIVSGRGGAVTNQAQDLCSKQKWLRAASFEKLSLFVHSLHLGQAGFDNEIYSTWHYQPPSNPEEAQTSEHLQVEMVRKSLPVDIHSRNLCGSLQHCQTQTARPGRSLGKPSTNPLRWTGIQVRAHRHPLVRKEEAGW